MSSRFRKTKSGNQVSIKSVCACLISLLPPSAAEYFFQRGCVKTILPPTAAEYYFERHVILTISRSEIVKMTCLSKHNSARSAVKKPFYTTSHPQQNNLLPIHLVDLLSDALLPGQFFGVLFLKQYEVAVLLTKFVHVAGKLLEAFGLGILVVVHF